MYLKGQFTIRWKLLSTHTHTDGSLGKFVFFFFTVGVSNGKRFAVISQTSKANTLTKGSLFMIPKAQLLSCLHRILHYLFFHKMLYLFWYTRIFLFGMTTYNHNIIEIFSLFPFLWMRTYFHFCDSRYVTDRGYCFLWFFTMQLYHSSFLIFSISLMKDDSVNRSLLSITNVLFLK